MAMDLKLIDRLAERLSETRERYWRVGDSAGPEWELRAADRSQGADASHGLRRQDHLDVWASLEYVSWKQRKAVVSDPREIYKSATAIDADLKLDTFAEMGWGIPDGEPGLAKELGAGYGLI
jgi:hypothetical protein